MSAMHTVYIALGTNLGDRPDNLRRALKAIAPAVQGVVASPVYETPPWGYADQPAFLNQAVKGETELGPLALLCLLKGVEVYLGRLPGIRYGPRLIDLDLIFYDDLVLETERLTLPHPRAAERAFVLAPLCDIAPDLVHPVLRKTVAELREAVELSGT